MSVTTRIRRGAARRLRLLANALWEDPEARLRSDQEGLYQAAMIKSHSQLVGFDVKLLPGKPQYDEGEARDADYYEAQHQTAAFRMNNWLLEEAKAVAAFKPGVVIDVGCGNGRFLKAIAPHAEAVIGVDWSRSPELGDLPENASFEQRDIVTDELPKGDMITSSDVLEHFPPDTLEAVVEKICQAGPRHYHVIACYDDGHSHVSILPPAMWLALFRKFLPDAELAAIRIRRSRPEQIACVITNCR